LLLLAGDIDRLLHGAPAAGAMQHVVAPRSAANASSVVLTADAGG